MSRRNILWTIVFIIYLGATAAADTGLQSMVWKDVNNGIRDTSLQTVVVSPDRPGTVYAGSGDILYKTTDSGKNWDDLLSFKGTGNLISTIAINPLNPDNLYAGTKEGVYRSADKGKSWTKTFQRIGKPGNAVFSIAFSSIDETAIFIGTGSGIYRSLNRGKEWEKTQNFPSKGAVYSIVINKTDPLTVYASTDKWLYKSPDRGANWKRIYSAGISAGEGNTVSIAGEIEINGIKSEIETELEFESKTTKERMITAIAVDPTDSRTVYVSTSEGIAITRDSGLSWERLSSRGLGNNKIYNIVIDPAEDYIVYAATDRGVFRYSKNTEVWEELYKGLVSSDIRDLAIVHSVRNDLTTLWAATRRGVFKTVPAMQEAGPERREISAGEMLSEFGNEPSIEEIREAAIIYAEVQPEKIRKWRKAAASRAWLPDLKVAYDNDKDWQSSYYYYSGKYVDDDITEGKDKGWSISVTWELGDLIWNSAQTSIDTRSRLMVQLRDDVLNEVTRLYFERRRLQIELLMYPPSDARERIEKALRLQELTANIDALTGSYLSKRVVRTSASGTGK